MPVFYSELMFLFRATLVRCDVRMIGRVGVAAIILAIVIGRASAADITDQRGHTIHLDKPAERTVFLPIPAAATYIAIDGTERHIVGMNPYSASAMREGILGKMFPDAAGISTNVVMGGGDANNFTPNVESILAMRPDVVFQWARASTDVIGVLDRAGLAVLGMRAGSQEDFAAYVAMMGEVSGKGERAASLVQRQQDVRSRIETAMADVQAQQRPRVMYLNRAAQMLRVSGKGTYNDFYVRLTGGQNVAADLRAVSTVTIEQILTWNPQVILLGNFDATMPADIYGDPRWQGVDAVKAHRVYRMPLGGYRWDPPSQESALTWIWLAGLLQPERAQEDLRAAMRDWYTFLYGHALTDSEIDGILFAAQNRASAGYERYLAR